MPFIACKLPAGLQIDFQGQVIVLVGGNIGENIQMVSPNGSPADNARRVSGYGITEISDDQAKTFSDWADSVTYKAGVKANGKLAEPFAALENGSILGPFKTIGEASKEAYALSSAVTTGFEGLDPKKEGTKDIKIEADPDAKK